MKISLNSLNRLGIMKKERNEKARITKEIKIVLIVLTVGLILSITAAVIDFIVSNNLHFSKAVIIQSAGGLEWPDGSFMIDTEDGIYADTAMDFEMVKAKWNLELSYGDSVFVVYIPSVDKDTHASSGLITAFSASSSIGVRLVHLIPLP